MARLAMLKTSTTICEVKFLKRVFKRTVAYMYASKNVAKLRDWSSVAANQRTALPYQHNNNKHMR